MDAELCGDCKKINPLADENYPGCGAAGGLGFCFLTFLNAKLMPGAEFILRKTRLEEYIKNSDLVITGEGCHGWTDRYGKRLQ